MGVNGVPVAPHGLIRGEDGAAASRSLFKCLPGPPEPIFDRACIKTKKKNERGFPAQDISSLGAMGQGPGGWEKIRVVVARPGGSCAHDILARATY